MLCALKASGPLDAVFSHCRTGTEPACSTLANNTLTPAITAHLAPTAATQWGHPSHGLALLGKLLLKLSLHLLSVLYPSM